MTDKTDRTYQEISIPMFALKFGGVGGVVAIALTIGFFVAGIPRSPIMQFLSYGVLLGVILWGQFEYRKAESLAISYGEAFGLGMVITGCFGILGVLYGFVHWTFVDPAMVERTLVAAETVIRAQGLPEDQVEAALTMQKAVIGPVIAPLLGMIPVLIIGACISLVTAIFMRRSAAP
jgi:hypothetical protein